MVDGVYWEYDQQTSTDWRTVSISNSTSTKNTITGLTVSTSVMHYLGTFCNGDWTNAEFFYSTDGEVWNFCSTAHTANIPTASTRVFGFGAAIIKSAGSTSRNFSLDYMGYRYSTKRGA